MRSLDKHFLSIVFCAFLHLTFSFHLYAGETPEIGKQAPDFKLMSAGGKEISLSDYKGKYVVLEWFNPDCPFVRKHYNSQNMQQLQKHYTEQGVIWLVISSSAEGKQGYCTTQKAIEIINEKKMHPTAFLLDHDGKVGRMYDARTTPHMFVINQEGKLIYNGAIDDKSSTDVEDIKDAKNYVKAALDEALSGKNVSVSLTQPYGCSVKYANK
jgi:peroxiredoxin